MTVPDPPVDPRALRTPADVDAAAEWLFGDVPRATGVLHPTSIVRLGGPDGPAETLRIDERAPSSPWDLFSLLLCRARADAVVTTGANLRAEPLLRHDFSPLEASREAFEAWRREGGRELAPLSLVLTSGRDLDLDHPVLLGGRRAMLYTGRDAAWQLESQTIDRGIELIPDDRPSLRAAVEFLRSEMGAATITIEAGATTARSLYDDPPMLDELLLSEFLGELPAERRAAPMVEDERLREIFDRRDGPVLIPGATDDRSVADRAAGWQISRFVRLP
ncbi:MAG: hypothetical protein AAGN46_08120 [Acidobacteriota bacterium]